MEVKNIFDLGDVIKLNNEDLLAVLQRQSLVRSNLRCAVNRCRRYCNLHRQGEAPLGHRFFCKRCRKTYGVLVGSFFEKSHINVRTTLMLLWHWVCEMRTGSAATSIGISRVSAIQGYRFFRDICSWKILQMDDFFLFGKFIHI